MRLQSFLLVATVVLAGCVGQPSAITSTNGVIIKSFTANPQVADFGVPVFIEAVVKNVGEQEAKNVLLKLIGLTNEWTKDGTNTIDDTWRTGTILTGQSTDTLFPADPSRGFTEGEEVFKDWKAFPPRKNTELNYEVTARAEYDYQTTSESLIRIVSTSYFRQTNNKGGLVSSKTSGGPLAVNVISPNTVIAAGTNTMTIQIEVQNVGGGKTLLDGNLDRVKVETFSRLVGIGPDFKLDSKNQNEGECSKDDLKLIGSRTGRIICEIKLPEPSPFTDMPISVKASYRYFVDSTVQVKVLPKR